MKDLTLALLFAGAAAIGQAIISYPNLNLILLTGAAFGGASWMAVVWLYRFLKKWRVGPKEVNKE